MKKVGIFLATHPFDGGAFQYSGEMLKAVAGMTLEEYEAVALYSGEHWRRLVDETAGIEHCETQFTRFDVTVSKLVKFGIVPARLWWNCGAWLSPLLRTMESLACDLWLFPAQDDWAYFGRFPSVVTVFDLMHRYEPGFPEVSSWMKGWRRDRHYTLIARSGANIIVDSQVGKAQFQDCYGARNATIHVLPYVAPQYIRADVDVDAVRDKYALPKKFFFYPAQFWPHKNHARLLQAIARIREQHSDVALVLAGAAKREYTALKVQVESLSLDSCIKFVDYVPDSDMAGLYRAARALVMPTFFGPTNIPPLEAFATRCPVAVSRIYAMPEQLGEAAVYFDPTDVGEIAEVLSALWEDDGLCRRLAGRGADKDQHWRSDDFRSEARRILATEFSA